MDDLIQLNERLTRREKARVSSSVMMFVVLGRQIDYDAFSRHSQSLKAEIPTSGTRVMPMVARFLFVLSSFKQHIHSTNNAFLTDCSCSCHLNHHTCTHFRIRRPHPFARIPVCHIRAFFHSTFRHSTLCILAMFLRFFFKVPVRFQFGFRFVHPSVFGLSALRFSISPHLPDVLLQ